MDEQKSEVLEISKTLKNLKQCVDANDEHFINDYVSFFANGMCWHVAINTRVSVDDYLSEAFNSMGLNRRYPVEMQIHDELYKAEEMYFSGEFTNKYDANTLQGRLRINLLNELIKYFDDRLLEL